MFIVWLLFAFLLIACGSETQRVIYPTPETFQIDADQPYHKLQNTHTLDAMHIVLANDSIFFSKHDGSIWQARNAQQIKQIQGASDDGSLPLWSVSPDGSSIAMLRRTLNANANAQAHPQVELWLIDTRTNYQQHILNLQPPNLASQNSTLLNPNDLYPHVASQTPRWSPDSQQVAFLSAHSGQLDVYSAQRNGLVTQLSNDSAHEQQLTWSSDSQLLAFVSSNASVQQLVISEPSTKSIRYQDQVQEHQSQTINSITWLGSQQLALGLAYGSLCNTQIRLLDWQYHQQQTLLDQSNACIGTPQWGQQAQTLAITVSQAQQSGLFLWKWGERSLVQSSQGLVLDLAWNPQGDTLAYRQLSGDDEKLVIWNTSTNYSMPSDGWPATWNSTGEYIAVGSQIFTAQAELIFSPTQKNTSPFGWYQHGFVYSLEQPDLFDQLELWRWDTQQAQPLVTLSQY